MTGPAAPPLPLPPEDPRVLTLVRRLAETAAALRALLGDQADALLDTLTGVPRLFPEAQPQLQRERDILQAVMDGAHNVHLVYLDPNFTFVRVNRAYVESCGYPQEELIGANHFALFPHAETEALFTQVRDTGEAVTVYDRPFAFPDHPERGVTYWDWTIAPVKDGRGRVEGLIFSSVETTAHKAIEAEREHLLEQMQTLLHMVSHDLRGPLAIILGYAGLLKDHVAAIEHPLAQQYLEALLRGVRRLDLMIQDLVEVTRMEGGQLTLELQPVALPNYLRDFLDRYAGVLQLQRIAVELPDALAPVRADDARLERILLNLLTNAQKYSTPDTPIRLRAWQEHGEIHLCVADQGQGIHPDDVPHLFERFYRARGAQRNEGIGLGLYITRMLVEAHGGRIRVDSAVDQGTAFTVTLPVAPA